MPRRRSLTPDKLAAAALVVIDRDGPAALTMRAVAVELRMSTMALYRYVDDRDELEGLVVERVLGAVDTRPPPPGLPPGERVEILVRRMRDAIGAHPGIVPLTLIHRHRSAAVLQWSEAVLGVLADAGFDGPRRVVALRGLLAHLFGAVQLEHMGPLSGPGIAVIADLPAGAFPLMARAAVDAQEIGAEQGFFGAVRAYLRGLGLAE